MPERRRTGMQASARAIGYVLDEYEMQRDVLGLSSCQDPGQEASRIVGNALAGVDAETTRRIVDALRQRNLHTVEGLDQLTARLMASQGIDPLVMVWLATISWETVEAQDIHGQTVASLNLTMSYDEIGNETRIMIGQDVTWFSWSMITMPRLPETVVNSAIGRPLRELLSHPLLDLHPFEVQGFDADGDMTSILVNHEHQWTDIRAATVTQLAGMPRIPRIGSPMRTS